MAVHGIIASVLTLAVALALAGNALDKLDLVDNIDNAAMAIFGCSAPVTVLVLMLCFAANWRTRRRPFHVAGSAGRRERLGVAALAGAGIGLYAAFFTGWMFSLPLDCSRWFLFPLAAWACCGRGLPFALLAVLVVHSGAELGGHLGWALDGHSLVLREKVTENNLDLLPWSAAGAVFWSTVLRAADALGIRRQERTDGTPPPRRHGRRSARQCVRESLQRSSAARRRRRVSQHTP